MRSGLQPRGAFEREKSALKHHAISTGTPDSLEVGDARDEFGTGRPSESEERGEQIEGITQALLAMSAFDFSAYVPVRGSHDEIDDLAMAARIAQEQLYEQAISANHLQSLLVSLPNPTILVDRDGRIIALNRLAESELGLAAERDFLPWLGEHLPAAEPVVLSEWREPIQIACQRDSDERHYLLSVAPLLSHFDDVDGHVITATDISKQVAVERQLKAARALAEANARARFSFLANISHEIRTPLNGILGFTELLLGDDLDTETREQLAMVDACGQHLLSLINEVLDLSRIDADRMELDTAPFALRQLLRECIDGLRISHSSPNVELELCIDGDLPERLIGDAVRLKQVIFNLLGNALEFTERGSVTLWARASKPAQPGGAVASGAVSVRIEVRDTGVGIHESKLDSLFEPFVQANSALERRHGGTGLGLAIVKRVIAAMGGRVGVTSTLGVGSTFWLEVQLSVAAGTGHGQVRDDEATTRRLRGIRVLLVEDNLVNRKVATRFLGQVNAHVTCAGNGLEALQHLSTSQFDLVLMDCQMPVMDGISAVKEWRQRETGDRRTPVIALTAHAFLEHREQCLAAGMDGYLRKPIQRGELYRAMANALDQAHSMTHAMNSTTHSEKVVPWVP